MSDTILIAYAAPLELVTVLVAAALMLTAGVGKRQLEWKPRPPRPRRRPKRPPDP